MEEFFKQGDRERELNIPISPLCDRYDTLIPESQINFIDFIVEPTFKICGDMLDYILEQNTQKTNEEEEKKDHAGIQKPWDKCISENKKKWQEKTMKVRGLSLIEKQRPSL
ncbi:dual specificity calcium/calmodulin-dependent 3',5'-cyclic nucleotide phosphodiesterase 1B-like [Episyrphus balteatus]|uniref:dual specificity calcium/calmodulin-dependent 3',5'-cyclic nucleotide phosphodiesterase 1B-like n=1 Tax=Episyrphus balteatus TaxID=286459 RepID=UPI00248678B3|nr:dual specificity calcium/calmodulin-dependent 3',5'-cyclic nucleotide phosphodiesterase 1B-like [Episyrphus balteatus]